MHATAVGEPALCLPFSDPSTKVATAGPWGLSSVITVPTDDGRCLWVAEDVKFADGSEHRNVAFEPDLTAPFGTCPTTTVSPPTPIVTMEGGDDPSILVQLDGGYRLAGVTHVIYRLFRVDPMAAFGVTLMGGGVAHWDGKTDRIVVPSPQAPFPWGLDLDLGDAMLVAPDGTHAFVWGCSKQEPRLVDGCAVARLDPSDTVQIFSSQDQWLTSTSAAGAAPQFSSGPWISSVQATPGGFEHVYIAGFGNALQADIATSPTGPWSDAGTLAACNLPAADDKSFCAGPVFHPEISDPTQPAQRVVSYSVGSTGTQTGSLADYWPRLTWIP